MTDVCQNPSRDRHAIATGSRKLSLVFTVDWGDDDLRATHEKPLTFCSFRCLAGWASAKADEHDGTVVADGAA